MLTPSMINNYVKSGLIHRPVRKKYGRAQLAQLSMICALKQAIPLETLKLLLASAGTEEECVRAGYESFRRGSGAG